MGDQGGGHSLPFVATRATCPELHFVALGGRAATRSEGLTPREGLQHFRSVGGRQGCDVYQGDLLVATKWRPEGHPGRLLLRRNPGSAAIHPFVGLEVWLHGSEVQQSIPLGGGTRRSPW